MKTVGYLIIEPHEHEKFLVKRVKDNEVLIESNKEDTIEDIVKEVQRVMFRVGPYVRNSPSSWYIWRQTLYLTLQGLTDQMYDLFMSKLRIENFPHTNNYCVTTDPTNCWKSSCGGRIQILLYVPCSADHPQEYHPYSIFNHGYISQHETLREMYLMHHVRTKDLDSNCEKI